MEQMKDLLGLKKEIMERVESTLGKARNYQTKFDCYSHLWQDDRVEFLRQFLLYGRILTAEERKVNEEEIVPDSPPTTDKFKEQVRGYLK